MASRCKLMKGDGSGHYGISLRYWFTGEEEGSQLSIDQATEERGKRKENFEQLEDEAQFDD